MAGITRTWSLRGQVDLPQAYILAVPYLEGDTLREMRVAIWKDTAAHAAGLPPLDGWRIDLARMKPEQRTALQSLYAQRMALAGQTPASVAETWLKNNVDKLQSPAQAALERIAAGGAK